MSIKPKITTVFVVGAGFSAEFGYPLTNQLLPNLLSRFNNRLKADFGKMVRFHHPGWDGRRVTLPYIEDLLTEWAANEDLLPSLRRKGPFNVSKLRQVRGDLLQAVAKWFHEIHKQEAEAKSLLLKRFLDRIRSVERPVIISFNWDYELDKSLFSPGQVSSESYGVNLGTLEYPVLLKPHGSLNWYPAQTGKHILPDLRIPLWEEENRSDAVYCFLRWRAPHSTKRTYAPWVVPPTHLKDFSHPMLRRVWQRCVRALGTARRVYFVGYSLPPADWHSRYIFRCGFHNQIEGIPLQSGRRAVPTGPATVYVVNPDGNSFFRIESLVGYRCKWINRRASQWLIED